MKKQTLFNTGLVVLISFLILCTLVPIVYNIDPNSTDLVNTLSAPTLQHIFGTDDLGRDIFIRILVGGRISLFVGFISVVLSILIGTIVGSVSGFSGGKLDNLIMGIVDFFLALPTIFIILALQVIFKPSIITVMLVIGCTSWMGVSRLVRGEFLRIKNFTFIKTARAYGSSKTNTIFLKILPNALGPLVVSATLGMAGAILTESVLSYLGLGVQPPHASWGNMLQNGQEYMLEAPWVVFIPGFCIFINVLSLNFIGEGLREKYE